VTAGIVAPADEVVELTHRERTDDSEGGANERSCGSPVTVTVLDKVSDRHVLQFANRREPADRERDDVEGNVLFNLPAAEVGVQRVAIFAGVFQESARLFKMIHYRVVVPSITVSPHTEGRSS
jgi:hypothetical protein